MGACVVYYHNYIRILCTYGGTKYLHRWKSTSNPSGKESHNSESFHTTIADINLSNPAQAATSLNNLFAYRPRFSDNQGSNLAAIFINLEGVFPCIQSLSGYVPICSTHTEEDDGFHRGKALIDSADASNQWRVSSSTSISTLKLTFGIVIQDCPEFTPQCFPSHNRFSVVCYLPRDACS